MRLVFDEFEEETEVVDVGEKEAGGKVGEDVWGG